MKNAALTALVALVASPALAHPGGAHEHATLGWAEHLALTAAPVVVVAAVIGLAVFAFRRRA
jgi:hypothetical protein